MRSRSPPVTLRHFLFTRFGVYRGNFNYRCRDIIFKSGFLMILGQKDTLLEKYHVNCEEKLIVTENNDKHVLIWCLSKWETPRVFHILLHGVLLIHCWERVCLPVILSMSCKALISCCLSAWQFSWSSAQEVSKDACKQIILMSTCKSRTRLTLYYIKWNEHILSLEFETTASYTIKITDAYNTRLHFSKFSSLSHLANFLDGNLVYIQFWISYCIIAFLGDYGSCTHPIPSLNFFYNKNFIFLSLWGQQPHRLWDGKDTILSRNPLIFFLIHHSKHVLGFS